MAEAKCLTLVLGKAFVNASANISPVGQYVIFNFPSSTIAQRTGCLYAWYVHGIDGLWRVR